MLRTLASVAMGVMVTAASGAGASADESPTTLSRSAAADVLKKGLEDAGRAAGPQEQVEILRRAAEAATRGRPENLLMAEALRGPTDATGLEPAALAERWRAAVSEAVEILEFRVQEESPLPDGFPEPTPLGEIAVQKYPVYRAARAEVGGGDDGAFMRLFGHISTKGISMTAPVEMSYAREGDGGSRKVGMSFLYRNTGQGTLGGDKVKVQDVGAMTAVSLGLRGRASEDRVAEAKGRLEAWLASHEKEYRAAGPIRTLVYNSPFLPEKRQFFEVQIPVEPAESR